MTPRFTPNPLVAALALSFAALSSGSVSAMETLNAQDVVVTASRVEKALADVNMSVSVIDRETIERNAQAKTIADLLESTVPGIRIQNDGGQGIDRVSIRGEDAFRTVVMVDGQRISEQKSMSGVPLLIDPSQVERIEVIRGPASVLYGSDAIGGAINIITKKGGDTAFGGSASVGFNSASNGKDLAASIQGSVNGWNYRLGAATKDYDNLDTPAGKMANTEFSSKSANAFLSYDIDPNKTIGLSLSHYDLDFESGSILYSPEDFYVEVPSWKRTRGSVFGEFKNINDYLTRLRIDIAQERNDKEMNNHVRPSPRMPYAIESFADNVLDTTSASVQADWTLGTRHYLITGYEFTYDSLDANSKTYMKKVSTLPMIPDSYWSKNEDYDGNQTRHALFATMESTLTDALTANYGVRYTWVSNDMDISNQMTHTQTSNKNDDGKAVFNLGLSYRALDNLTLRANWAQGYRAPILQELFIDTTMGGATTYANPNLEPETSDNFEVGARYQSGFVTIDGAVFYSDADNYIATIQRGVANYYENIGRAKTLGFELDTSLKLGDFEPYTTLTLLRREYNKNGIESTKSGTPKITARYGVRYGTSVYGNDLRLDAYAVSQSATEQWNFSDDKLESSYGGATTFNLTGGVSFGPQGNYSFDAGFYNITNKLYQNNGSIYEAGRHFAVKLNARF